MGAKTIVFNFVQCSKCALMDYLAASCSIFQCFIWGNDKHMIEVVRSCIPLFSTFILTLQVSEDEVILLYKCG